MAGSTRVFRPLFITRIAMFAFVLVCLVSLWTEFGPALVAAEPHPLDVAALAVIVGVFLWISWRNWHLGVRVSDTEVTVLGFFRDRTVPRSSVSEVSLDAQLVWYDDEERFRTTPIAAFFGIRGGLGSWVVERNERMLAEIRREILGEPEKYVPYVDDRSFDSPSYRRPRIRRRPQKHVGRYKSLVDVLPAVAMLGGSLLFTAFAGWTLFNAVQWMTGQVESPVWVRLVFSADPYSRDDAIFSVVFHSVLAAVALGLTIRLLYLVFRPGRKYLK